MENKAEALANFRKSGETQQEPDTWLHNPSALMPICESTPSTPY